MRYTFEESTESAESVEDGLKVHLSQSGAFPHSRVSHDQFLLTLISSLLIPHRLREALWVLCVPAEPLLLTLPTSLPSSFMDSTAKSVTLLGCGKN